MGFTASKFLYHFCLKIGQFDDPSRVLQHQNFCITWVRISGQNEVKF